MARFLARSSLASCLARASIIFNEQASDGSFVLRGDDVDAAEKIFVDGDG
jgi:hypothetical protein